MQIKYAYCGVKYETESEAQAAVAAKKVRLENNPTDWCVVKEVHQNEDGSYAITPVELSDAEINNPDESKKYLTYAIVGGGNTLGLTASDLSSQVLEYRTEYANYHRVDKILKITQFDDSDDPDSIRMERIPLNVDMSGYV